MNLINWKVAKLPKDVYCTDVHWFPANPGKKQITQSELLALGCTDGNYDDRERERESTTYCTWVWNDKWMLKILLTANFISYSSQMHRTVPISV